MFEAVKHGGWTVGTLLLGLIGPDLTFLIGIAWYARLALDRALGYGPRTADGRRRAAAA